jgi:hypothetical protein
MARSSSVFLTGVVAMVLGVVIGVVGLAALSNRLNPSAGTVANQIKDNNPQPVIYGSR